MKVRRGGKEAIQRQWRGAKKQLNTSGSLLISNLRAKKGKESNVSTFCAFQHNI